MLNYIMLLSIFIGGCSYSESYRVREYKSSGIVTIEKDGVVERYHRVYYPSTKELVLYRIGGE